MRDRATPQGRHADQRLREAPVIWLTTVSAAGQPQSSPVWFLWDGGSFLIYSRPGGKVRNIAANPRVALHLSDNGTGGDIVTLEGAAEVASDVPPADQNTPYLEKYRDGIARIGMTPERFAATYRVAIRVTPTRFRVW
ncbi:MAG: TIGR03667 family PPOX class F420-dependent oxidoreductase [Chloroflexota bacterium]